MRESSCGGVFVYDRLLQGIVDAGALAFRGGYNYLLICLQSLRYIAGTCFVSFVWIRSLRAQLNRVFNQHGLSRVHPFCHLYRGVLNFRVRSVQIGYGTGPLGRALVRWLFLQCVVRS